MPENPAAKVLMFAKFGAKENMERLMEGSLYFNTLAYFAGLDDGGLLRGDPNESLTEVYDASQVVVTIYDGHKEHKVTSTSEGARVTGQIKIQHAGKCELNICCLYAVTP